MSCEGEKRLNAIANKYNIKSLSINNNLISALIDDEIATYLTLNIISDFNIEILLTELRKSLLYLIVEDNIEQLDTLKLQKCLSVLSQQCFNTEFVFYVSDEEKTVIEKSVKNITWINILILSCYKNIQSQNNILEFIHQKNEIPLEIQNLIKYQITDYQKESELKHNIKQLDGLSKDISAIVKQHYESNPYPRWFKTNTINQQSLQSFTQSSLHQLSNNIELKTTLENLLVIGCGTGLLSIEHAKRFPQANIISIDLSLSSLAYAKRMADELEINNIEFIQMDLMNIDQLNCEFDYIDCIGVLSHISDVKKACEIIIQQLSNGGVFRFSLYSHLGRKFIQETADYIQTQKYSDSEESIRQLRYDLIEFDEFKEISELNDFYYISGVRDLFFHQFEQHYDISTIKKILEKLECQFLGFELADTSSFKNLNLFEDINVWHEFEQENPDTFKNDYIIWLQKNG